MSKIRVLVAEDDPNILRGLADILDGEGYEAVQASDGQRAIELFEKQSFDLVLLDIMMPGRNGYDVCRAIRARNARVPVIMLTAKGEEIDKVVGLQLGADDYITKPFGVHELRARLAAALRRTRADRAESGTRPAVSEADFEFGEARVDTRRFEVRLGRKTLALSEREVRLLRYFHDRPNEVLSRDELLNAVWGIEYYGTTRTLDQHIAQLRKKIEPRPAEPRYLATVHGVGYRYVPRPA